MDKITSTSWGGGSETPTTEDKINTRHQKIEEATREVKKEMPLTPEQKFKVMQVEQYKETSQVLKLTKILLIILIVYITYRLVLDFYIITGFNSINQMVNGVFGRF